MNREFQRTDDEIVALLSHWLMGSLGNDELRKRVEEIGTDELAPGQRTAVSELLDALQRGRHLVEGIGQALDLGVGRRRHPRGEVAGGAEHLRGIDGGGGRRPLGAGRRGAELLAEVLRGVRGDDVGRRHGTTAGDLHALERAHDARRADDTTAVETVHVDHALEHRDHGVLRIEDLRDDDGATDAGHGVGRLHLHQLAGSHLFPGDGDRGATGRDVDGGPARSLRDGDHRVLAYRHDRLAAEENPGERVLPGGDSIANEDVVPELERRRLGE